MGLVKFYRGTAGVSLPTPSAKTEGSIFIVERADPTGLNQNTGDMYVDIENAKRLHIVPDSPIKYVSKSWMNSHTFLQPATGEVYVIADYETNIINGETVTTPGIKVGDGNAYLVDLPIFYSITQEKKDFWDNKLNEPTVSNEELIFTTSFN